MKILICGSMRLSREMLEAKNKLEDLGYSVQLPDFVEEYANLEKTEDMHRESVKNKVDYDLIRGYFKEIEKGDAILVVNETVNGIENYIGGNSFLEMGFAHVLNKKIYLLNDIPEIGYKDEIIAMQPIVLNGDLSKISK